MKDFLNKQPPEELNKTLQKQPPEVFFEKKCSYKFHKICYANQWAGFYMITEACNLIKKETLAQVFSYEFCEICKTATNE